MTAAVLVDLVRAPTHACGAEALGTIDNDGVLTCRVVRTWERSSLGTMKHTDAPGCGRGFMLCPKHGLRACTVCGGAS